MSISSNNKLSVNESQKIIKFAAEGRAMEIDRLLSAVQSIFLQSVKRSELEEVYHDLNKLIEQYDFQSAPPSKSKKILEITRLLIKSVELDHGVPEDIRMHTGYHGEVISDSIREAFTLARNEHKGISLRKYMRNYSSSLFRKNDPKTEKALYFIRPSISIPNRMENGIQKMFFVITLRAKGKKNLEFRLILREMNSKNADISWFRIAMHRNGQIHKKGPHFTSLFTLLSQSFRGYFPIQQAEYKEFDLAYLTEPVQKGKQDQVEEALLCPVSQTLLESPTITANGYTYSKAEIISWLAISKRDPLSNTPCEEAELRQNRLITDLLEVLQVKKQDQSMSEFLSTNKQVAHSLFQDPLSLQLLQEPVIAPNGITYDREALEHYLAASGGYLPESEISCSLEDLYINRLASEILSFIK